MSKEVDYQKLEFKFLDSLDIASMIEQHSDLHELMTYIETKYGSKYKKEDYIFNYIDHIDFLDYLQKRYNINVYERTRYTIKLKEK